MPSRLTTLSLSTYTGQGQLVVRSPSAESSSHAIDLGGQAPREQGEKWDNTQIKDQEWKLGNLALKVNIMIHSLVTSILCLTILSCRRLGGKENPFV